MWLLNHLYPFYVISFDESLNKKVQMGQIDILIHFWTRDKILQLGIFFGGAKVEQKLTSFEKGIQKFQTNPNIIRWTERQFKISSVIVRKKNLMSFLHYWILEHEAFIPFMAA